MPDCPDEFRERGEQLSQRVYQKYEINRSHGFSPLFARLDWRDVSMEKSG
jgi:hypothetical protein